MAAIGLRTDYSAAQLPILAARTKQAEQSHRLLSLAVVLEGMSRADAAQMG